MIMMVVINWCIQIVMRADKMRDKAKKALQKSELTQLSTSLLLTVNMDKLAVVSPTRTSVGCLPIPLVPFSSMGAGPTNG